MIKINEKFSYEVDQYNWTLFEWFDGKDKDGNPKKSNKKTYHAKLSQMLATILDHTLKGCESFQEIKETGEMLSLSLVGFEFLDKEFKK